MRNEFFSENENLYLFSCFDSIKYKKSNLFRIHHHAELELGYICEGEGEYVLNGKTYPAHAGDLFLVRTNEQHCVPSIYTPTLVSFNFYLSSNYIWNVCGEYLPMDILRLLIGNTHIPQRLEGYSDLVIRIQEKMNLPKENRFVIRKLVLELILQVANELNPYICPTENSSMVTAHLNDIQNAITYINTHLSEHITLDDIAHRANLSRSHMSALFTQITGIPPYEYLIVQRIERAVVLLQSSMDAITVIAQQCGFSSIANFNRCFKRIAGMTPEQYRKFKMQN